MKIILFYSIDLTTVDAVTPMFTVTTALRSVNATGPLETTAVVGETLYWTIDIPGKSHSTLGQFCIMPYAGSHLHWLYI